MECMDEFFDSYVNVFGINVIASGASDERLLHTAGVLAQYLDNDADGTPDDPAIAKYLADNNYVFPVWTVEVREEFWSTPCGIDKIAMVASSALSQHLEKSGVWPQTSCVATITSTMATVSHLLIQLCASEPRAMEARIFV